jgi:hypothetical protein
MNKNNVIALTLVMMISYSCSKYDDGPFFSLRTKKGRLVGEWELDKLILNGQTQSLDSDYDIIWEFERDGDFEQTLEYGSYSYGYNGDWEFDNNGEELEIEINEYGTQTYEINRLTNNELWIEINDGGDKRELEFEKN